MNDIPEKILKVIHQLQNNLEEVIVFCDTVVAVANKDNLTEEWIELKNKIGDLYE